MDNRMDNKIELAPHEGLQGWLIRNVEDNLKLC